MPVVPFIAFEGGEGAGKSTQIKLLSEMLKADGIGHIVTREPGGTPAAEAIRELLLSGADERWNARSEALLFAAARADHVARVIRPTIAAGQWVLCDRFVDSSRAYQSAGEGLDDDAIMQLHAIGSEGLLPDLTILLEISQDAAAERIRARDGDDHDRFQRRDTDFHKQVAEAFHQFAEAEPDRFLVISAEQSPEDVHAEICGYLVKKGLVTS
ncbi:dTMP kinase [Alterisphingorhabdus coralli]|uniref:Thymidylate kinase n=1 Tax=Alterisphingorhabdus coralli TaxID=3071408 RepID=A0AA97F476_9SPHN|nr:dTMP kinase [Parasphingorhabdus sp. SCSIO 66989]WOE74024.1 dTMP kinase [Parasphingorhabdus sp. SCSIO 66989]